MGCLAVAEGVQVLFFVGVRLVMVVGLLDLGIGVWRWFNVGVVLGWGLAVVFVLFWLGVCFVVRLLGFVGSGIGGGVGVLHCIHTLFNQSFNYTNTHNLPAGSAACASRRRRRSRRRTGGGWAGGRTACCIDIDMRVSVWVWTG